jgi:4,5-DOPA dioxygenase extradiol
VSHGAPTFAIEPGALGSRLAELGKSLADVAAILVVSAHWQSMGGVKVMTTPRPQTVHDFGGFPAELYALQYPAQGHPQLAGEAVRLLEQAGFPTTPDDRRGLDHGAWVPLHHMLPNAGVPVFQVSMPASLTPAEALVLGKGLAPLREQGVMIMTSGSMTHNLHEFRQRGHGAEPYVREFAEWVRQRVADEEVDALVQYRHKAPHAARAHPTQEHFLPLLVAMGARSAADELHMLDEEVTYGVLSMESYVWHAAAQPRSRIAAEDVHAAHPA